MDAKHKLIVDYKVSKKSNDLGELDNMALRAKKNFKEKGLPSNRITAIGRPLKVRTIILPARNCAFMTIIQSGTYILNLVKKREAFLFLRMVKTPKYFFLISVDCFEYSLHQCPAARKWRKEHL